MSKRFAEKIAVAFLLLFPLSLFSQWTLVTSHNATSSINAVWAQDANTAYAVTNGSMANCLMSLHPPDMPFRIIGLTGQIQQEQRTQTFLLFKK